MPSRLKVKLGTQEMKLKGKIRKCLNLLPQESSLFTKNFEYSSSGCETALSQALSKRQLEKTKRNPFFLWDDVKKLKVSLDEYEEVACMIAPQNEASDKLSHYQTLVEELVNSLKEAIYKLCRSQGAALPSSFPQDFKPGVNIDVAVVQVSSEVQQAQKEAKMRILLEADQQEAPEVREVLEAERPQHRVEKALLEADRSRLETLEVPLELHQPREEVA